MLIGRLAPSPTGAQHVGNARTFLLAWLSMRSRDGKLILRIEDIDSPRVKSWAVAQAVEDLVWLGLDWDEGPDRPGKNLPYVQTDRVENYLQALEKLKQTDQVYPCTCTRSDVMAAASAPHETFGLQQPESTSNALLQADAPIYPGTCSGRHAESALELSPPFSWRYRTNPAPLHWIDRLRGPQSLSVKQDLGDFVVARQLAPADESQPAETSISYQLAVTHDDHAMGVTEVVRGDDLIASTFRQLELYNFFGWQPPEFLHAPLVVGPDSRRLAKRHGDTRLSYFREQGVRPQRILGLLGYSLGWLEQPAEIDLSELLPRFSLEQVPLTPFVFGKAELDFLFSA